MQVIKIIAFLNTKFGQTKSIQSDWIVRESNGFNQRLNFDHSHPKLSPIQGLITDKVLLEYFKHDLSYLSARGLSFLKK